MVDEKPAALDPKFLAAIESTSDFVTGVFKPLTMDLAKEVVGKDLPRMLHAWRRLYLHAQATQDQETANFLASCIEDLERLHARTY